MNTLTAVLIAVLLSSVSAFFFGEHIQSNADKITQAAAINSQKSSDYLSCSQAQTQGTVIGNVFQNSLTKRDSDYDSFLQRNAACTADIGPSNTGRSPNAAAKQCIILPAGAGIVNLTKYAKLLRTAETERNQVIGLQTCIRDPKGCYYPSTERTTK